MSAARHEAPIGLQLTHELQENNNNNNKSFAAIPQRDQVVYRKLASVKVASGARLAFAALFIMVKSEHIALV